MTLNQSEPKKLIKSSTLYAAGNILRQLVSFVMLPVYTRHLTPADYGVVGVVAFAIAVFEALLGAKMVQALPKFYHDQTTTKDKHAVVSTAFVVTGCISALTVTGVFMFRDPISIVLFSDNQFGLVVGLSALQMLAQALEYYALMYIRLIDRPVTFITINILKLALQLSLNIWLVVYQDMGVLGVVISGCVSTAIFAAGLSVAVLYVTGIQINTQMAKRMLIFSWPLWLSGLASLYIYSSNKYYIRIFDSLHNVGLYELAAKLAAIITLVIWTPFSQYWQTEQFRLLKTDNAHEMYDSIFRFSSAILVLAGLGVSIFADPFIKIMAAPEFWDAAHAVPFLVAATILGNLTDLNTASFLAKEQTGWLSKNNYVTAIIVTGLYFSMIPLFGYVGAAAALAGGQMIRLLTIHHSARKRAYVDTSLRPLLVMGLIATAGYAIANYVLAQDNLIWDIAVKSAVFAVTACTIVAVLVTHEQSRERLAAIWVSSKVWLNARRVGR